MSTSVEAKEATIAPKHICNRNDEDLLEGGEVYLKDITLWDLLDGGTTSNPERKQRDLTLTINFGGKGGGAREQTVSMAEIIRATWVSEDFVKIRPSEVLKLHLVARTTNGGDVAIFSFSRFDLGSFALFEHGRIVERRSQDDVYSPAFKITFSVHSTDLELNVPVPPDAVPFTSLDSVPKERLPRWILSYPSEPQVLCGIGDVLLARFKQTLADVDVKAAIVSYERAIRLTTCNNKDYLPMVRKATGAFLLFLLHTKDRTRQLDNVRRRISRIQAISAALDESHVSIPGLVQLEGRLFLGLFEITANTDDLDRCVDLLTRAIDLSSTVGEDRKQEYHVSPISILCYALRRRFELAGNVRDINTAIWYLERAHARACAVEDEPQLQIEPLTLLAEWFLRLSIATNSIDATTRAIEHQNTLTTLLPVDDPRWPQCLSGAGVLLLWRSQQTGSTEDLDSAVDNCEVAVDVRPDDQQLIANLSSCLAKRAALTKKPDDISRSLSIQQQVLDLMSTGPSVSPQHQLFGVATMFLRRYSTTFAQDDLIQAISMCEQALSLDGHGTSQPDTLTLLSNAFILRFQAIEDVDDISRAVSTLQQLVEITPSGDHRLSERLSALGFALYLRFNHNSNIEDIDKAILAHEQACTLVPGEDVTRSIRLMRSGLAFLSRFDKATQRIGDLDAAMVAFQEAIVYSTAPGSSSGQEQSLWQGRTEAILSLGFAFNRRFEINQDPADLLSALSYVSPLARDMASHPDVRLAAASLCARLCRDLEDGPQSLSFCAIVIKALLETVPLEQSVRDRYANIALRSIHGSLCASIAIRFGDMEKALEWMEQGRCVVWTQIGLLKSSLETIYTTHPDIANRFDQLSRTLQSAGVQNRTVLVEDAGSVGQDLARLQQQTLVIQQWRDVVEEIQSLDGYSDVFKPLKASSMLEKLPHEGPVVLFNTFGPGGYHALALVAGVGITHIHLPSLQKTKIQQLVDALRSCLREKGVRQRGAEIEATRAMMFEKGEDDDSGSLLGILAELWIHVAKPVLAALGYAHPPERSKRPRIWWCPTGKLSFLPLHAAGIYGEDYVFGSCVSDYVVSSYTPNVTTLLQRRDERRHEGCPDNPARLLLVSQPNTPGLAPIPGTIDEVVGVKGIADADGISCSTLAHEEATLECAVERMKEHNWIHFAAHAVQDADDPLQSGIHLFDGRLDLRRMMKERFPDTTHAFLSACQTGTGEEKLAEEVVHVAAGMLAAGYRGIVATSWSISDGYGAKTALEFYRAMSDSEGKGGRAWSEERSAYALDRAVQALREDTGDNESGLQTWVPYVHFGV